MAVGEEELAPSPSCWGPNSWGLEDKVERRYGEPSLSLRMRRASIDQVQRVKRGGADAGRAGLELQRGETTCAGGMGV